MPEHYDDGGFSGGSMNKPALKALISDIKKGWVDIVGVYKVDRLTHTLFDTKQVSFVSVAQAS